MKFDRYFLIIALLVCAKHLKSEDNKYLIIGCREAGLFSNFFGVLNHIIWCDANKITPYVYWDNISLYFQSNGFNGAFNVWEYYFEQISNLTITPILNKMRRDFYAPDGSCVPWLDGSISKKDRLFINFYIQRFIRIKEKILNKVDSFYNTKIAGIPTIAIHLRGTDKIHEAFFVDTSFLLSTAQEFAQKYNINQFLIATDEQKLLEKAKNELNGKVIYYDCYRSKNSQPLHQGAHPVSKGQIGEDILVEALLLSKCSYFVHTFSNVSIAVQYFNPEIKNIYIDNKRNIHCNFEE